MEPRIFALIAIAVLSVGIITNVGNAFTAGLDRGGDIFALCVLIQLLFLAFVIRAYLACRSGYDEATRKKFLRTGLWMVLPLALMFATGIGMIALLSTFLSFLAAAVCCFIAAALIRRRLKDELQDDPLEPAT